ncbi:Rrp15p-domain-containing protein [Cryphonectria parasitica EP155]|uniref:Rrp15p-domain-containing protein n=1 Tax=Cryphonectria parasitica (strain ATCC 38755 / EP155) TaxID=660469 RepID=A0A9P4YDS0_CRYP1|nr:Rrp15p-domain-containing protein [Cryphonectria parasitica EP155]KAF3771145.1 Rrp15p-domain-containing protein [Cryphonectria parasitica EP155]
MAGTTFKKRSRDDALQSKATRPTKKQKKQTAYHSESESAPEPDNDEDFQAVNLLDSDEDDIHTAQVDDGGDTDSPSDASDSESKAERVPRRGLKNKKKPAVSIAKNAPESRLAKDAPASASEGSEGAAGSSTDDGDEGDEYSDLDSDDGDDGDDGGRAGGKRTGKSKRSDPAAFATSMSKILSTKLSSTRRADPVLARSAAAHEASRQAVDNALETKARKKMRDQKRLAMEKGRVRDVLVATNGIFSNINPVTGDVVADADGETTAGVLETERRLRKVAQRGVVQLFNAFRTAQVKAAEAERVSRKEGVIGVDRKKEKVTEMSKKGFLDLIASSGGGLKKGPLEEA